MIVDIGFWDKDGVYREDLTEVSEMEITEDLKKSFLEYLDVVENLAKENAELKAENERLKEEIETRDNLIDHFRDEALYRATIANEYQKDKTKLEQTLQEIKEIIDFRFKTSYMTFGYKEYDKLIEDIDKIVNEVIGAEE